MPGSSIPVTLFTQISTSGVSLVKPRGFHLHSDSFAAPKLATAVWVYLKKKTFAHFWLRQELRVSLCQSVFVSIHLIQSALDYSFLLFLANIIKQTQSTQRAREQSDFVLPSGPKILNLVFIVTLFSFFYWANS